MTLQLKGFFRFYPLLGLPLFILCGIIATLSAMEMNPIAGAVIIGIPFLTAFLILVYRCRKFVNHIELLRDGEVIFTTVLGKEYNLKADDFIEINSGYKSMVFKTLKGNFLSTGYYEGFSEFVTALQQTNPRILTKKC